MAKPLCCWWLICIIQNDANNLSNMTETLTCGYSSDSTQRELSNEHQNNAKKLKNDGNPGMWLLI